MGNQMASVSGLTVILSAVIAVTRRRRPTLVKTRGSELMTNLRLMLVAEDPCVLCLKSPSRLPLSYINVLVTLSAVLD